MNKKKILFYDTETVYMSQTSGDSIQFYPMGSMQRLPNEYSAPGPSPDWKDYKRDAFYQGITTNVRSNTGGWGGNMTTGFVPFYPESIVRFDRPMPGMTFDVDVRRVIIFPGATLHIYDSSGKLMTSLDGKEYPFTGGLDLQRIQHLKGTNKYPAYGILKHYKPPPNPLQEKLDAANQTISQLQAQIAQLSAEKNALAAQVTELKSSYETKLNALEAAKQKELEALRTGNAALLAEARQEQEQLSSSLEAAKKEYEAALEKQKQQEAIFVEEMRRMYDERINDFKVQQQLEIENAKQQNEAAMTQARQEQERLVQELGSIKSEYDASVSKISTLQQELDASKQSLQQSEAELAELKSRLDTLTATPAPTTPPPIQWGTSMYVLIDADAWMNEETLVVMAMNGNELTTEPFQYRDMRQVFAISSRGHLRCLGEKGLFVEAMENCRVPTGTETPPEKNWSVKRVSGGASSQYSVMSESCGSFMVPSVSQVTLERQPMTDGWFVIPVGRFTAQLTTPSS
jgi:hypothetical protein